MSLIKAKLVFDGSGDVKIPSELVPADGTLHPGAMAGTPHEKLIELAGKTCYDSLNGKKSRPTKEYISHIMDVGHGSVLEHAVATFSFVVEDAHSAFEVMQCLVNRPGVWVSSSTFNSRHVFRVTLNFRAAAEWLRHSNAGANVRVDDELFVNITSMCQPLSPLIFGKAEVLFQRHNVAVRDICRVSEEHLQEKWVSLYMSMGRTASHEQVRHKFHTAVSQRSSRYCDESESPWVTHPLYVQYFNDSIPKDAEVVPDADINNTNIATNAKKWYEELVDAMQNWLLTKRGLTDKTTARKQARGAARMVLGSSLFTEMIFSASVEQWQWMLKQRASAAADAEIRELFAGSDLNGDCVLEALRQSRYASHFKNFDYAKSPDGIGRIVVVKEGK